MAKQPEGEIPPVTGELPEPALGNFESTPFSFYIHVPFCSSRCGYCDFNTYTAEELGISSRTTWADTAIQEVELAAKVIPVGKSVSTIFIGGGTPTLLPASEITRVLAAINQKFPIERNAEITIEANPDSVDLEKLSALKAAGINRISFGMQSASSRVLKVLERSHSTGAIELAVAAARAAGIDNINIDLIYGTPGETLDDLRLSLDVVTKLAVEHVSAYALIVEDGTRLARQISQGDIASPDDDDMADKYELIDTFLSALGMQWYELSNWSFPAHECEHNLNYWKSHNWWGIGPGAHSHIGGVRWWNAKHPNTWTHKLSESESPAVGREILTAQDQQFEDLLLRMRLREGFAIGQAAQEVSQELLDEGLIHLTEDDRAVLTLRGRLLADAIVHRLTL
ncbi:MAG: coproporphyrinogen oxidase [Actinomycetota bacterium]